jgi:hypothetical protein
MCQPSPKNNSWKLECFWKNGGIHTHTHTHIYKYILMSFNDQKEVMLIVSPIEPITMKFRIV